MNDIDKSRLVELWSALCNAFLQQLKADEPPNASMLNVARQFLRDNGITADSLSNPLEMGEAMEKMLDDLPSFEDSDWKN